MVVVIAAIAAVVVAALVRHQPPPRVTLPLRQVGEIALPGDSSRFDYASLDTERGLLFIAHLGASEIIEIAGQPSTVRVAAQQHRPGMPD
jgi:hypothetical protein